MNLNRLVASSKANPCPICGRTKDADCRIAQSGSLVLCHHNFGETCPDGWRYVKPSADDRTGVFVRDLPKTARPIGTIRHQYSFFDRKGTVTATRTYDAQGKKKYRAPNEVKSEELLPYRWHEVADSPEVFIVEGELDCDRLHEVGIKAISCRLWTDRHAELLKCKTAIIIPDCDTEGIKKATKTAELLAKHGVTVKWCCLPRVGNWDYPKPKDGLGCYDFFQLGGTVAELRQAITDLALFQPVTQTTAHNPLVPVDKDAKVFDLLMAIVSDVEFFKQGNEFGEAFADVVVNGVRRTYRLRSTEFRTWLTRELYSRYQKPSNSEALETCLKICEAKAMDSIKQVWLKVAGHEGKVYLDLCNDQWQAIEVSKQGWRIVESRDLPVRFVRSPMQEALPIPMTNGDLAKLWEIMPIAEESRPLIVGWLLSCLVPTGEKPIIVLSAPKGSGKSTIARFLVNLIDANQSALLPAVGDRRALAVQSRHRWIFAYDNLTRLSVEQQDALCCASTGAGYMERKLFTDDEVSFIAYCRPQILTSVDLVPTRSDLLDRCLLIKVTPIPECDRKNTEELNQLFHTYHADILGALLDLLCEALKNWDSIKQPLQRMASFHRLGLASGIANFHDTYLANIGNAQIEAVRANPISDAIVELGNFNGTAEELVAKLKAISDHPTVQKLTSRTLGRLLNGTLRTDLEAFGLGIDNYRTNKASHWLITQTDKCSKLTPQTPLTPQPAPSKDYGYGITNTMTPHDSTDSTKTPLLSPSKDYGCGITNNMTPRDYTDYTETTLPKASHSAGCVISGISVIKNGYLSVCGDHNQRSLLPEDQPKPHYFIEDGDQDEF